MNSRADRAKVFSLICRMLRRISLGRGRFRRRHARDGGTACELFEMDVSKRKGELQRHRCNSEPTTPPPLGTNPTHWQNAPTPRLEQSIVEPIRGNAFGNENITAELNWLDCCPNVTVRRRTSTQLKHRRRQQRRTSPVLTRQSASRALSAARSGSAR